MFESVKKSYRIFKESWNFLSKNRDLWWIAWWAFPLFILCCVIAIGLPALIGFFALSFQGEAFTWHNLAAYLALHYHFYIVEGFLGVIILFISICVACVFCNSMAFICIYHRMYNQPMSLFAGLRQICPYLLNIFLWGLLCSVAKLFFQDRRNRMTDLVVQSAWEVISYFVVPIMIDKNVGPITAITLSKQSLAKEWKSILGFGAFNYLFYRSIGLLIVGLFVWASNHHEGGFTLLMIMIGFPLILMLVIITQPFVSLLGTVLKTALYIDSVLGNDVALHFDKDVLSQVIVKKQEIS